MKRKSGFKNFFVFILLISACLVAPLFLFLPNVSALRYRNPARTRFMEIYLDEMEEQKKKPALHYEWRSYNRISPNLVRAVLVAEDDMFYEHNGFDWKQTKEAVRKNWKEKAFKRGASTITQQLAKNLYLTPSKNPYRKARQWIITYQMERTLTKRRILELYLNIAEWGPGIYGAESAARHYFDKSASALSPRDSAFLAAILPSPHLWGANPKGRYVSRRTNMILGRMNIPLEREVDKQTATHRPAKNGIETTTEVTDEEVIDAILKDMAPKDGSPSPFLDD